MTTTTENLSTPRVLDEDSPASTLLEGKLIHRRERRRPDLLTADGLARENARQWRRFQSGAINSREYHAFVKFSYLQLATLRTRVGIETVERENGGVARLVNGETAPAPSLGDFYSTMQAFKEAQPVLEGGE